MSPDFEELSRRVAAQFLQSVVVVDDKAYLFKGDQVEPHTGLVAPQGLFGKSVQTIPPIINTSQTIVVEKAHKLDAKALIDSFAEKGLVCSVLAPLSEEDFQGKVLTLAERADIIVLDWILRDPQDGSDASQIIEKILDREKSRDRVRLIAVYSAESPSNIVDKIATLGDFQKKDSYTLMSGSLRICAFAKEGTLGVDPDRIIKVDELPSILISEFAQITMGLLSNAALGSMAAIRKNTHKILGKFRSDLDAPYLSHRILNNPPEEAEMHIIPLVASEIESVLNDSAISDSVSMEKIESWLEWYYKQIPTFHRRMHIQAKKNAKQVLLRLLKKGISEEKTSKSRNKWKKLLNKIKHPKEKDRFAPSELTGIFAIDGRSDGQMDREFALLLSTKTQYLLPVPELYLGTIVAKDNFEGTEYLVCIQPKCDCLRLPAKGHYFPFLPLDAVSSSDFGYVVYDNANMVDLRLNIKPNAFTRILFKPTKNGHPINASRNGDKWIFSSADATPADLRWIAELKPDHAQRIANDFAREISRVGLAESEWLRRCAKKDMHHD